MPNWCATELTITGDKETLDKLQEQMRQPYQVVSQDYKTGDLDLIVSKGEFQLWNAIHPTDFYTYFEIPALEKRRIDIKARALLDTLDPADAEAKKAEELNKVVEAVMEKAKEFSAIEITESIAEFHREIAEGQGWYAWNIREWGTKWEIDEAWVDRKSDTSLEYSFSTAWSPCASAVDRLAEQYPTLNFVMFARDENGMFTCEIQWADGEQIYNEELPESHEMNVRLAGSCWACQDNDPEYATHREELGCEVTMVVPESVPNV